MRSAICLARSASYQRRIRAMAERGDGEQGTSDFVLSQATWTASAVHVRPILFKMLLALDPSEGIRSKTNSARTPHSGRTAVAHVREQVCDRDDTTRLCRWKATLVAGELLRIQDLLC